MYLAHILPGNVLVKQISIRGNLEDVAGKSVHVGKIPRLYGRILPRKSELDITNLHVLAWLHLVRETARRACQTHVANLVR